MCALLKKALHSLKRIIIKTVNKKSRCGMSKIFGRNPVVEALESKQAIDKIYLQTGSRGTVIQRIYRLAKQQRIPVVQADRRKLTQMSDGEKHQGVLALLSLLPYISLADLVDKINRNGETPNLVIVDRMNDPHNMGAIIRSAEVLGAHGIIFSVKDSTPITETVVKVSAGAVFHIDMCKSRNIVDAIRYLRDCGIWIYSSSSHSEKSLWQMDFSKPQAIIVGSEGKGVRRLLQKESDETFRIPQSGKTESLNASVAAGIILAEVQRQRTATAGH